MDTNLTKNELGAALVLVASCLHNMGGTRPIDLEQDEFTWIGIDDLMRKGWNRHEAAGTFGALMEKGFVSEYDRNEWVLTTQGWRWLETVWDEQAAIRAEYGI